MRRSRGLGDVYKRQVDGNISVLSDNFKKSTKRKHKGHRVIGKNTA
jgi:hypothetical protein